MAGTHSAVARQPIRHRGRLRVAAILKAGAEVMTERGYDGATMTEIAARSGTAIGSLYRFFPSKESLADALLDQFARQALDGLAELAERAAEMSLERLAGAFVDFKAALQSQRGLAIALAESRGGSEGLRKKFQQAARASVAAILVKAIPTLSPGKAELMAIVLLGILQGVPAAAGETPAMQSLLLAEIRQVLGLYLAAARP